MNIGPLLADIQLEWRDMEEQYGSGSMHQIIWMCQNYENICVISVQTISPEAAQYETCYVTAHKGPCRAGAFHHSGKHLQLSENTSANFHLARLMNVVSTCFAFNVSMCYICVTGQLIATGSEDASIKVGRL